MAGGVMLGALAGLLLLLAGSANCQQLGYEEQDYTLFENQNPNDRLIQITKESGTNIGSIIVTLDYFTLQQFRDMGMSEAGFDLVGLDSAELNDVNGLPDDFIPQPMELTFPPSNGLDSVTFTTMINADDIHEEQEGYFIVARFTFDNPADVTTFENSIGQDTALIRIENDDIIQFGYELTAIPVTEDSGTTQVVFGKLGSVTTEVVLTVMVDFASISVGTEEGNDFTLDPNIPVVFTFQPDEVSQSLALTIIDDNLLELDEMFRLSLFKDTSVEGAIVNSERGLTIISIVDNEFVIFGFSEIAVTEEEDVGIAMIGFRFTDIPQISPQFAAANELYFPNLLTIDTPDSAVAPDDYTSLLTQLQIRYDPLAGFLVSPESAMVMIINDGIPEDTEEVLLNITSGSTFGGRDIIVIDPPQARLIIRDNDENPSIVGFVQDQYNTTEGDQFVAICVSVIEPLDRSLLSLDYQVNLTISLESVTAVVDEDFGALVEDFTITRDAPELCFDVMIEDDDILEVQEYFRATLVARGPLPQEASLGITEARIDIFDNDDGTVGFDPENIVVTEGVDNFAIVEVRFISPVLISDGVFVNLMVFTMDGSAQVDMDYSEVDMNIMLVGGVPATEIMQIMVPILDDIIIEDTESLTLVFSVNSDSGNINTYSPTTATITILDIDVASEVVIGLEQELYETSEDETFVQICAALLTPGTLMRLSESDQMTLQPDFQADLSFSLSEISALVGEDFTDVAQSFLLTPSVPFECFDVPINDDDVFELSEYFNASLNLEGPLPVGASLGITEARVRIDDNEMAVVGFREVLFSVDESVGAVKLYVEFLSPDQISSDVDLNITLVTVDVTAFGGSDFVEENVAFTLKGGTDEVYEIDVGIMDDNEVERPESEEFNVEISSSSPLVDQLRITVNPDRAVITIIDNDEFVPAVIGIEMSAYSVNEGDGEVEICVAIIEPAEPTTLQTTYSATLTFSTAPDTATANVDYGEFSAEFALTPTSLRQCFNISIIDDIVLETPEDFLGILVLVGAPPPATTLGITETRVTIMDNDEGEIGFTSDNVVVVESDGVAMLMISFLNPAMVSPSVQVNISLTTADNTAMSGVDYEELTIEFSLTGGTSAQAEVIIVNDQIPEVPSTENLIATLTLLSFNVPITLNPDTALVTILDDDNITVVGFEQTMYTTREGDGVLQICAVVLEPSDPSLLDPSFELAIFFSLEDDTATAPDDYIDVNQELVLTASATRVCTDVEIVDDEDGEDTEEFRARLMFDGALPAGVILMPDEASVSIFDNEVPSIIGFERSSYSVGEGAGVAEICVLILAPDDPNTLPSSYSATVNISTMQGNAIAPDDFLTQFLSAVLTPVQPIACIDVTIEDDMILEIDEFFSGTLTGSLPPTASFNLTSTTVLISDNEVGIISILNESVSVREDVGTVTVYFGFTAPDEISSDIIANITFFTEDSSATAGLDYTAVREAFILQQGMETQAVTITILTDNEMEDIETFETSIEPGSPLPDRVSLNPDEGSITIDDVPMPDRTSDIPSSSPSPSPSPSPGGEGEGGMGGDPHYSIMLPSGHLLCFSVHGEKNFPFNLISNSILQMNAFFIEDAVREEITWIGSLGVVVQHTSYKRSNSTKIRFEAKDQMIYINNGVSLLAKRVEKLTLSHGKLTITEGLRRRGDKKPEVQVDLADVGLHFTVRFVKKRHLDMIWNRVDMQPADSHGFIGQFFRKGVEVDETRKLLYLPTMEPVPVMRSSVWHFMERETPDPEKKFCWQTMNPGYQGKMLIEGSYLDYLVDDVLSSDFKFNPKSTEF